MPPKKYENSPNTIWFKSTKGNGYCWLSNFYPDCTVPAKFALPEDLKEAPCSFDIEGKTYKTVEHFFQSMKYVAFPAIHEDIRQQPTALEAKKRNTHYKKIHPIDVNEWSERRLQVMKTAIHAKFFQNSKLAAHLLSTGDAWLGEVPGRGDRFWPGGEGYANALGSILMDVRETLRREAMVSRVREIANTGTGPPKRERESKPQNYAIGNESKRRKPDQANDVVFGS